MPVLLIEKQTPRVTVLTLNRPERRNALTIELMSELVAAIESANGDNEQRILILKGAGKAFCTGMDLNEVAQREKAHASAELVAKTLITLSETRLITIATVHGAAVAGGTGIMSACDFVVAAEGTKLGYPEVRRGLVPGMIMTFLRRQLRERDLRELLFAGDARSVWSIAWCRAINWKTPPKASLIPSFKVRPARSPTRNGCSENFGQPPSAKISSRRSPFTWKRANRPKRLKAWPLFWRSARQSGRSNRPLSCRNPLPSKLRRNCSRIFSSIGPR